MAGQIGARRLVLIKPPGASGGELVDAYFERAMPARIALVIVNADEPDALDSALSG